MPVAGFEIGPMLIRALGLPKYTRSFELIVAAPDEPVIVRCEYYPDITRDLLELKEYTLVERDDKWAIWRRPYLDAYRGW